jgi:hypothetical protein
MFFSRTYLTIVFICFPVSAVFCFYFPEVGPSYYQTYYTTREIISLLYVCILIFGTALLGVSFGKSISNRMPYMDIRSCEHVVGTTKSEVSRHKILAATLVMIGSSIGPYFLINEYGALNQVRIIYLPEGTGRYYLLLSVFNSAASLFFFFIGLKLRSRAHQWLLLIFCFSALFFLNSWSGGRTTAVIYSMPLAHLIIRSIRFNLSSMMLFLFFFLGAIAFLDITSNYRSLAYTEDPFVGGIISTFKFELGRAAILATLMSAESGDSSIYPVSLLTAFEQFLLFEFSNKISINEHIFYMKFGNIGSTFFAAGGVLELIFVFGYFGFLIIFLISALVPALERRVLNNQYSHELILFTLIIFVFRFSFIGLQSSLHFIVFFILTAIVVRILASIGALLHKSHEGFIR